MRFFAFAYLWGLATLVTLTAIRESDTERREVTAAGILVGFMLLASALILY